MRGGPIKYLGNCFTLVGCERRNVYQRLHSIIMDRSDHSAGIRVAYQDDWPSRPLDHALKGGSIIAERGERNGRRGDLQRPVS
jgi:hypothetical protein